MTSSPKEASPRPRRIQERRLLVAWLPLVILGALLIAVPQREPREIFVQAIMLLGSLYGACLLIHLLFGLTGFDGDEVILPVICGLVLIGGVYHADLAGPATRGLSPGDYRDSVLAGLVLLGAVVAVGPYWPRVSTFLEDRLWVRAMGDRPYDPIALLHMLTIPLLCILLLLLMFKGIRSTGGALVQVSLPFGIRFTPSEPIRILVAFFLADYLGRHLKLLRNIKTPLADFWPLNRVRVEPRTELLVVLGLIGLYSVFFFLFSDGGPAAVIFIVTLLALYAATGRLFTPLLAMGLLAALIGLVAWLAPNQLPFRQRIAMWLDPWNAQYVFGDHLARALWTVSSGGWWGMGPGVAAIPGYLPWARSDAAFAGLAGALGFVVAVCLLGLFAGLTQRGMAAAIGARNSEARMLAFTLTALLTVQAVWICGAVVQVFPFTGINLPFISTGKSSMLMSALAIGVILNISRRPGPLLAQEKPHEGLTATLQRLRRPMLWSYLLPAAAVILYGCPWLLGDVTFQRTARAPGRGGDRSRFENPYLVRFRNQFERGRIFSSDGALLAVSRPGPEERRAIRELNPDLERSLDRGDADPNRRLYPLASAAAQLVGWRSDNRFSAGEGSIETEWDSLLRGYDPGKLAWYFRNRHNPLQPRPQPQDLQLSVDARLQRLASQRLESAVKQWGGRGGAVIMYDLNSGDVLCAATAPSFSPNTLTLERMTRLNAQHRTNGVLTNKPLSRSALFYPGSTFKILTLGAALDADVEARARCTRGRSANQITWSYGGKSWKRAAGRIRDYGSSSHGALGFPDNAAYALAASCNVFFATTAAELGVDEFREALEAAELKEIPEAERLAEYLPETGFGQITVRTSPVELAMLSAAAGAALPGLPEVAASRPHWVRAVVTKSGVREPDGLDGAPDRRPYRPFSQATAEQLREMMLGVVEERYGTAHAAFFRDGEPRLPGISVGGKTGTAEFDKRVSGRTVTGRHAWFTGFARSDHEAQPRSLAFAVLLEDVKPGTTGGGACAPLARELIANILPLPGEVEGEPLPGLDRFYEERVRPHLGPLAPLVDWLKERSGRGR